MTKHYCRETFPLERKDETGKGGDAVVQEVKKEIVRFGADMKGLKESLEKDLADVRKIAEGAKGVDPELEQKLEALTTSVSEKNDALDKALKEQKERADALETALNRPASSSAEEVTESTKNAVAFYETKASVSGSLKWQDRPTAKNVDLDGYKAWEANFGGYMRVSDSRQIEEKALSVGSNPDGGYLIPTARSNRIIEKVYESSPLRQLATVESIGGPVLEIYNDTGEAGYGWVGEVQARTETSTPESGTQRIPVHEIYAKPKATQQFLEDASIDVENWLARKTGDQFGRVEAAAFITGNGVKKPRGITTYNPGSAGARDTIKQVNSGAGAAITADAIVGMPLEIKAPHMANGVWLMTRSTVQAVMLLKDGQGQYLWRPSLVAGVPSTLGGYAISIADDMPVVGAGSLPIAFGDFRAGYTVVDRLGITTLRDPFTAKPFVEFYTRKRVGGDVVDFEAFALMKIAS